MSGGGRFDFEDGGTYCGGWEEGKAHGHGVCTGPKGQGEYAGAWQQGFELNGVYLWPSGNRYEGQWTQGKRHGLGAETKGRWSYKGEWTQGFKGRYGVRLSTSTGAKYEGTWTTGLQDGYGVETYADGGEYKGQWLRGMRHGYGTRHSVPYGVAASYHTKTQLQLTSPTSTATSRASDVEDDVGNRRERGVSRVDESRGGFVLKSHSDDTAAAADAGRRSFLDKHRKGPLGKLLRLSLRKQRSTGDINDPTAGGRRQMGASMRSTVSTMSRQSNDSGKTALTSSSSESNHSFVTQDDVIEADIVETYMGEWKNDKRSGFGISERTDGLKYVGEWYNNKKYGYGVTTLRDGRREEGKYKNNVLVTAGSKSKLLFAIRSSKLRERIDSAVAAAVRAAQIAKQKADIAVSRMHTAKAKAELAEVSSQKARADAETARQKAKEFAPDFQQHTGADGYQKVGGNTSLPGESALTKQTVTANHASLSNSNKANSSAANNMAAYNVYPSTPAAVSITPVVTPLSPQPTNNNNSKPDFASTKHQRQSTASSGLSASATQASTGMTLTPNKASTLDRAPPSNASFQRQDSGSAASSKQRNTDSLRRHGDPSYASLPRRGGSGLPRDHGSLLTDDAIDSSYYADGGEGGRGQSPSRESGVTASDYGSLSGRGVQLRRKSLPSIVKNEDNAIAAAQQSAVASSRDQKRKAQQQQSRMRPEVEYGTDYVIENGVRKRITAESGAAAASGLSRQDTIEMRQELRHGEDEEGEDAVADLPRRYRVETPQLKRRAGANLGSLPDVSVCRELSQTVMPREEVYVLSERRRDELRRQREEEERRRHMQVVLSLYDFKDWCYQRQMLMLILALNIGLATMFFNLLSR